MSENTDAMSRVGFTTVDQLSEIINQLKSQGTTVGLCHGCFDVVHFGHLRHLEAASRLVDVLFVSITSNKYVNKGPTRPIFSQELRAELIAGFHCVKGVVISDFPNGIGVLEKLKPNIYFKGQEYHLSESQRSTGFPEEVRFAMANGIEVRHTFEEVFSSTETLSRLYSKIQ